MKNARGLRLGATNRSTLPEEMVVDDSIAKLLSERGDTFLNRQEAVKRALDLGQPLNKIEEWLDWLDCMNSTGSNPSGKARGNDHTPTEAE